jgi:hypothetical protein
VKDVLALRASSEMRKSNTHFDIWRQAICKLRCVIKRRFDVASEENQINGRRRACFCKGPDSGERPFETFTP